MLTVLRVDAWFLEPLPHGPPFRQGGPSAAWSQALTGPLRADDLYSGDNLRLTFEARASWRRFLSHTLRWLSPSGQLDTAARQVVLPGEQPPPGPFLQRVRRGAMGGSAVRRGDG